MLRIDKTKKNLIVLKRQSMREAGYWERRDIQEMICRSPDPFCDELGEYIHIVGSEVAPTDFVQDRIDLLEIDPDGSAVVIEIKRDSHKLHLLQALAYAGMVAKWEPKQFVDELHHFNIKWFTAPGAELPTLEDTTDRLEDVLEEGDIEAINRQQRIILLAEAFDYEVLVTCEWLTEQYELDIRCYRIALAQDGDAHFLTCTRAYPPPELTEIAIRRRKKRNTGTVEATDWPEALKTIQNRAVAKFFENERKNTSKNNVKYKSLTFEVAGKRRFVVLAKRQWARVWQNGRFDDDVGFWTSHFGADGKIQSISDGRSLRFYLTNDIAFEKFKTAMRSELQSVEFTSGSDDDSLGEGLTSE